MGDPIPNIWEPGYACTVCEGTVFGVGKTPRYIGVKCMGVVQCGPRVIPIPNGHIFVIQQDPSWPCRYYDQIKIGSDYYTIRWNFNFSNAYTQGILWSKPPGGPNDLIITGTNFDGPCLMDVANNAQMCIGNNCYFGYLYAYFGGPFDKAMYDQQEFFGPYP